eukprot:272165-Chlamydomonas_euryale.AAC.2
MVAVHEQTRSGCTDGVRKVCGQARSDANVARACEQARQSRVGWTVGVEGGRREGGMEAGHWREGGGKEGVDRLGKERG